MDRLPIYRLRGTQIDSAMLIDTAARVFGINDNFKITDRGSRLALDRGDQIVEVEKASAGISGS